MNNCYPLIDNGKSYSSPDCILECAGLYNFHIGNICHTPSQPNPPHQELDGQGTNGNEPSITLTSSTLFDHDLVNNEGHRG
eukprot:8505502-Heterocapsa_arctica.AAC.1